MRFSRNAPTALVTPAFILGNPWKTEPYGYVCSNGKRAFIALNNCTWNDVGLKLQLNRVWGLAGEAAWDLYRWYPDPAQLRGNGARFVKVVPFSLRPFEVVLLEAVPAGTAPSLGRSFSASPLPGTFDEPSRELTLATSQIHRESIVKGEVPPCQRGGTLAITTEMRRGPVPVTTPDVGKYFAARGLLEGGAAPCRPVLGNAIYAPTSWQAWRISIEDSPSPRTFQSFHHQQRRDGSCPCEPGVFSPSVKLAGNEARVSQPDNARCPVTE